MDNKILEIFIPGPAGRLEAKYYKSKKNTSPICLVLHPHPQYGGTMNNKVVVDTFKTFIDNDFSIPTEEISLESGLRYLEHIAGDGEETKVGNIVIVHYSGFLSDGRKFDSSHDRGQPFNFTLGEGRVIKGWEEGLLNMRKGAKRTLIIPPELGYGSRGAGGVIPPDATLVFEVELIDFK